MVSANLLFDHFPVMTQEVIDGLNISESGCYLDATIGGGGHGRLILDKFDHTTLVGLDHDEVAIAAADANLAQYGDRVKLYRINFAEYDPGSVLFDGIIADLGVSSVHLDTAERGFSFRKCGQLDMRMDQRQSLRASDIINYWDESELADIFYRYGEERLSRRIAKRIVQDRPFTTTIELAQAIASVFPMKARHGRIHPATRVFQALRIVVNMELRSLEELLTLVPHWLKPEGRIAVISFHSLEDRIVKHSFKNNEQLQVLTKKPITPSPQEISLNQRSRSAKLRIAQKVS